MLEDPQAAGARERVRIVGRKGRRISRLENERRIVWFCANLGLRDSVREFGFFVPRIRPESPARHTLIREVLSIELPVSFGDVEGGACRYQITFDRCAA